MQLLPHPCAAGRGRKEGGKANRGTGVTSCKLRSAREAGLHSRVGDASDGERLLCSHDAGLQEGQHCYSWSPGVSTLGRVKLKKPVLLTTATGVLPPCLSPSSCEPEPGQPPSPLLASTTANFTRSLGLSCSPEVDAPPAGSSCCAWRSCAYLRHASKPAQVFVLLLCATALLQHAPVQQVAWAGPLTRAAVCCQAQGLLCWWQAADLVQPLT